MIHHILHQVPSFHLLSVIHFFIPTPANHPFQPKEVICPTHSVFVLWYKWVVRALWWSEAFLCLARIICG